MKQFVLTHYLKASLFGAKTVYAAVWSFSSSEISWSADTISVKIPKACH
jgi:hypothetical protein